MANMQKDVPTAELLEAVHIESKDSIPISSTREDNTPNEPVQDWSPEEEKALVKKADLRVFPMLCVVFGLSLLDRTNISTAYIAGMGRSLDLAVGSRYSIALLAFFPGYALFELPSNAIIRRLGARVWLTFLIISWGLVVLGTGFVQSWKTLTLCRTLLGIFEAGLFPGSIFIIGSWYRQFETGRRITIFYMAALLTSAFGPILAYALSLISVGDGDFAEGWRWIFIIEGIITVLAGLVAPFLLVEFPERVKWLTAREKEIAFARLMPDKKAREYVHPTTKEMLKMLCDWKLLFYSLQYFVGSSSTYAIAFYAPIILQQGMGFSYTMAQLLSSPPYIFTIIMGLVMAWISDKRQTRWPILCVQSVTCIVGLLIMLYGKLPGVQYFGLFLSIYGTSANLPLTLTYGQSNTADVRKKGVVAAAMIGTGAAGGICGSTIFKASDAPRYLPGMWAIIAMQMLYTVATFTLSMYLKRQNKLADEGKRPSLENLEGFRYAP